MKKKVVLILFVLFLGLVLAGSATAADSQDKVVKTSKNVNSNIQTQITKTTIPFIENKGQYPIQSKILCKHLLRYNIRNQRQHHTLYYQ